MKNLIESWQPKLPPSWDLSADDLAAVVPELNTFTDLFDGAFKRIEPAELFELYLQGLLSHTERKNSEALALALDSPETVRNLQRFMRIRWCWSLSCCCAIASSFTASLLVKAADREV